ncbi:MAG: DUF790 family protein [Theionarchaea archaeon]|nr:DUF790 family protein [Theionarchaea archaeon]
MFSRELLTTRKRNPYITPVYLEPRDHELAERVIHLYVTGKSRGEIDTEISAMETHSTFRQMRGFSELMRRRTRFEPTCTVNSRLVRQALFQGGVVTSTEERTIRVEGVARELGVSAQEVEAAFWADREEFQVAVGVDVISPDGLVQQYNLSLTQTLLFDALSLEIQVSGNLKEIFRTIKFLGLMYEILPQEGEGEHAIRVTGPAALFRKTKKYGTALARLFPAILRASSWTMKAQVETQTAGEPRIYIFELSDSKKSLFPESSEPTVSFDSSIEEDFQHRLSALRKDWVVRREPTVLRAGPWAMIPDFSIERRGRECLIEIVGFWTPEYLQKKIEKIQALREEILLLVNKDLQCTVKDFQKENVDVILYDKKIPMKPILERIKKIEDEQVREEIERLSESAIDTTQDIIHLEVIARDHGVGIEAVKEILKPCDAGTVIGDTYINRALLGKIRQRILDLGDDRLSSAVALLEEFGLKENALSHLGFTIEWKSLDPHDARVVKK